MQTNLEWQKADLELLSDEEEGYGEWRTSTVTNGYKRTSEVVNVFIISTVATFVKIYQTGPFKYV